MFFDYILEYKLFGLLKRAVQTDSETGEVYWEGPWRFRMESAWQDLFLASLDDIHILLKDGEKDPPI